MLLYQTISPATPRPSPEMGSGRSLFTNSMSPSKQGSATDCQFIRPPFTQDRQTLHSPRIFPEYCRKLSICPAMWFNKEECHPLPYACAAVSKRPYVTFAEPGSCSRLCVDGPSVARAHHPHSALQPRLRMPAAEYDDFSRSPSRSKPCFAASTSWPNSELPS